MKKSMVFFAGHQVRSPAQLGLKTPELPDGFQQDVFYRPDEGGASWALGSACTQFSEWLMASHGVESQ